MSIKKYAYNDFTQLSKNFNVQNFKCKCGEKHCIYIDTNLIVLLEKIFTELKASKCVIFSAYRCKKWDLHVGGSGSDTRSHKGYAVDCYFYDKSNNIIPSKTVCLKLEDMGHKFGIAYRCGGAKNSTGKTHIDTKPRKWYADESVSFTKACCTSFYSYFNEKKPDKTITYVVQKGDNLSKIAKKYNTTWQKIYDTNKTIIGDNPNIIKVGMKLIIKL